MDASDESDLLMPPFIRGPNPYLDQEKCLLCGVDRHDPTLSENEKSGIKQHQCICVSLTSKFKEPISVLLLHIILATYHLSVGTIKSIFK